MNTFFSLVFLIALLVGNWLYLRWALTSGEAGGSLAGKVAIGGLLALLTFGCLAGFIHWVSRTLKGKLRLQLSDGPYSWGSLIEGTVTVICHRQIPVERITVTLLGEKEVQRSNSGSGPSTTWVPISETSVDLPSDASLLTGEHVFPFRIPFPNHPPANPTGINEGDLGPLDQWAVDLVKMVATAGLQTVPRWTLSVRIHTPGADLSESRVLRFNT